MSKENSKNKYPGITSKKMSDGSTSIMVRFMFLGKKYPVKNFTNLYGITTQREADIKLGEIKTLLAKNIDPFNVRGVNLTDKFFERINKNTKNGNWRPNTIKGYTNFFNAHIKKKIGHKKLDKITPTEIEGILNSDYLVDKSASYRNILYRILNPIFKESIAKREIHYNPCDIIEHEETSYKEKLEDRVEESHIDIIKILYKAFKHHQARYSYQRDELNMFFLLLLLSGHRQQELLMLNRNHCYPEKGYIISPKDITKTKRPYKFPIPDELMDYILQKPKNEQLFPNMKLKSIYFQFRNILKYLPINIYENKSFSPHDLRSLMLSLMITKCGVSRVVADVCLEHKQTEIVERY
eukprot:Anaeramoba_ignava/a225744_34.p1 GENE.a225744_34~~a225744_34.p1  ORF type:complete len:353 (-),score=25.85 a225744_34:134-1192(-)